MDIVITHGVRTGIGKVGGSISQISTQELGKIVLKSLINHRANINPLEIDGVIFGNVKQSSQPSNIARYIALDSGLTESIPAYTVHRQCGSGLQSIIDSYIQILCNKAEVMVAGGVENMSLSPYFIRNTRNGLGSTGNLSIEDSLIAGGPGSTPASMYGQLSMGITAENIAHKYNITREEQDIFAHESQMRANAAAVEGRFKQDIVPVKLKDGSLFMKETPISDKC